MDRKLLEELYRAHYAAVFAYCITLCGSEATAEDLAADAFVKAYLSLPGDIPSFRWWLLRGCRNLWIDQLRRNKHLAGSEALDYLTDAQAPENKYIQEETYRSLWSCIAALPPGDRELLILHYFSELPLKQIAALTGVSYPALRQRMVRLRIHLKQHMEDPGYGKNG